jgi:hypothetical protein
MKQNPLAYARGYEDYIKPDHPDFGRMVRSLMIQQIDVAGEKVETCCNWDRCSMEIHPLKSL